MPRHEGVVTSVKEDGSALVYIGPGESGIPGAPDANVCHCATESSHILIEAVNSAGASSGDRVSVYRKAGVLIRNALALIGTPLTGALLGVLIGARAYSGTGWVAVPAIAGMAAGLLTGIAMYRRFSPDNQTVITHILERAAADISERGLPLCAGPVDGRKNAACDGCGLATGT